MTVRTYGTPIAFKQALEQRLRVAARTGVEFARKRQLLVFDRFLARITAELADAVTLKGGLVLELRLDKARTTKDIDLRVAGPEGGMLARLQQAGRIDLGDFMIFEVTPDTDHPEIRNDGLPYDGLRFRVVCLLAGKLYGQTFGVDIAFDDPMLGEPEVVVAEDVLDFAGIAPPTLRLYPVETHLAEKLHAYTMPRKRPNSRVKDLPDIGLLAGVRSLEADRLRAALDLTFRFRNTHPLPGSLPAPPVAWAMPYESMAREYDLPWSNLHAVTRISQGFFDPVLSGFRVSVWHPEVWAWR
jgi:hypothetical protein